MTKPNLEGIAVSLKDLQYEFEVRYQERLGHLCADRESTDEQKAIAHAEAYAAIIELNRQSRKEQNFT